jgi:putative nucleotidyltransferase with HDIG domain
VFTRPLTTRIYWAIEVLLLAGVLATTILVSRADEWGPPGLLILLLALALVAERLEFEVRGQHLSASLVVLVLAMSLLGPAPAVALGLIVTLPNSIGRRLPVSLWLNNLLAFAAFPLIGGLIIVAVAGDIHHSAGHEFAKGVPFMLLVFGVFMLTNAVNFGVIVSELRIARGLDILRNTREMFLPVQPGQLALGALTAILAGAYTNLGIPTLFSLVLVLMIFQYLIAALLRSEDRADQIEARSIQLAALQFGVLATLMDALALRDKTAARHATAVSRYAKALAAEAECSEQEQEVIHTAGLLHDIGKFTWPDRVLHPEQLTDEDLRVIQRHPQDGAALVGKLDGYGPVADAILYHHERVDGDGYPAALIGSEIPLSSRIVAICSTYDTMTVPPAPRTPLDPMEAIEELRRVAGTQLDSDLVEKFIVVLEREGLTFGRTDADDFETELAFERRVRTMAQPRAS